MKILVINGPNINLLGMREPDLYGKESYGELCARIEAHCTEMGVEAEIYQSNHEGALVDKIQQAWGAADGIVINPAAYTHTSVAILDALKAVAIPAVEVHISDIEQREDFRRVSYVRQACFAAICGRGTDGYLEAIDLLAEKAGIGASGRSAAGREAAGRAEAAGREAAGRELPAQVVCGGELPGGGAR